MLLLKLSLLTAMAIPVAALRCQNEVTDVTGDRNWVLAGCGPCRKYVGNNRYSFETHLEMPNDDADDFKYNEDNDETYKSLCEVCRSNYGPKEPGRGDYGPKQPEKVITSSIMVLKLPKETPSITNIRITQTKPRVRWSTLPGPDDGTTFAWFTKTTTHTETETETETTTTTASTTISLRKSTATSMGLSETSATLDPEETGTPTPQKKKRSSTFQTVGIVIAVIFFILFAGLVAWKCLQHRHQAQPDQGPEDPIGDASVAGGSAFDDSDSESDGGQARNLIASIRDWFRRHQSPFPPPNEPEEPAPDVVEERVPNPGPPPPIPVQPGQAPAEVEHSYIPPTPPAIPGHQVGAPSVQVPTPDPAQDRSNSSTYSQDSGYPKSLEIPKPLSIHRSHRRQEERKPLQEWTTTGEPVQAGNYGWV
ncbi:hypothetical protein BFJ66_g1937 [Fusarium oxysporum f. sp. cepae]|uniref:Uncharacterized protein n=1 Tax=Fusarium oxysporum f. sp. cepae TaxID=396571 RepID=A0A3L6NGQ1_FUSOX|nr:hypothetical protein BFJ65_g10490 [Fusarium oxysporum f. sp. cepae]RKK60139.1 hypothetical protein BFJ66_g1937 [Fusarium oxysporum f. sp. cepae]RKK63905.1 hypothetical protein BFJ67_g547 [Fusarium oxysporum f. sp. cepae]